MRISVLASFALVGFQVFDIFIAIDHLLASLSMLASHEVGCTPIIDSDPDLRYLRSGLKA
jgi:hypothetical protein